MGSDSARESVRATLRHGLIRSDADLQELIQSGGHQPHVAGQSFRILDRASGLQGHRSNAVPRLPPPAPRALPDVELEGWFEHDELPESSILHERSPPGVVGALDRVFALELRIADQEPVEAEGLGDSVEQVLPRHTEGEVVLRYVQGSRSCKGTVTVPVLTT